MLAVVLTALLGAPICSVQSGTVNLPAQDAGLPVVVPITPVPDARTVFFYGYRVSSSNPSDHMVGLTGSIDAGNLYALRFLRVRGAADAVASYYVATFCSGVTAERGLVDASPTSVATHAPMAVDQSWASTLDESGGSGGGEAGGSAGGSTAGPAELQLSTSDTQIPAGELSALITVRLRDSNHQPIAAPADVTVTLTSSSGRSGYVLHANDAIAQPLEVTIRGGATETGAYYRDFAPGVATLTASATGLTAGTLTLEITAAETKSGCGCSSPGAWPLLLLVLLTRRSGSTRSSSSGRLRARPSAPSRAASWRG